LTIERNNLFIPSKLDYARGVRPAVDCILCSIIEGDAVVERLELWRDSNVLVTANIHPYNPGHLMVLPLRHVVDPRDLTPLEWQAMNRTVCKCMSVLEGAYQPSGFNVGFNTGGASGASIDHLHMHIVPRYHRELGFMDIIGGSRIIVEDPVRMVEQLSVFFQGWSSVEENGVEK
jgi:ATP adenylyltransferase